MRRQPPFYCSHLLLLHVLLRPAVLLLTFIPVTAARAIYTTESEPRAATADIAPFDVYFEQTTVGLLRRLAPADDRADRLVTKAQAAVESAPVSVPSDATGETPPAGTDLTIPANQVAATAPAAPIAKPLPTGRAAEAIPSVAIEGAEAPETEVPADHLSPKQDVALPTALEKDMMCDPAAVDGMMDEMDDIEICATDWARFYDRAMGVSWNGRTVQSQGEMIELFCATPCGPVFDGMLKDFRDACQEGKGRMMEALQEGVQAGEEEGEEGDAGRWVHVPEFNRLLYRMLGFVGTYGCMQDSDTGMLCAELTVRSLSSSASARKPPSYDAASSSGSTKKNESSPETKKPTAAAEEARVKQQKCAYYTSCCFGEMMKTLRLAEQDKVMEGLERDCPGATAAAAASCERSAAGGR
ncbi:hypothetical protein VYU27_008334 [Nannochloropsis oceanica]